MSEPEWLTCQQLRAAFADEALDALTSLLLSGAMTGELTARAGKAIFGRFSPAPWVERDWLIPPAAWRPTSDAAPQFSLDTGTLDGELAREALGIDFGSPPEALNRLLRPVLANVPFRFLRICFHRLDVLSFLSLDNSDAADESTVVDREESPDHHPAVAPESRSPQPVFRVVLAKAAN